MSIRDYTVLASLKRCFLFLLIGKNLDWIIMKVKNVPNIITQLQGRRQSFIWGGSNRGANFSKKSSDNGFFSRRKVNYGVFSFAKRKKLTSQEAQLPLYPPPWLWHCSVEDQWVLPKCAISKRTIKFLHALNCPSQNCFLDPPLLRISVRILNPAPILYVSISGFHP